MQPPAEHLMKGLQRRTQKGFQGYPLAIVVFYGHNDKIATKAVIGIIKKAGGSPESIKKWIFAKMYRPLKNHLCCQFRFSLHGRLLRPACPPSRLTHLSATLWAFAARAGLLSGGSFAPLTGPGFQGHEAAIGFRRNPGAPLPVIACCGRCDR